MIVSMTGYGQGEAASETTTVTAEIRSVNHRFLDFSFKLPRSLQARERNIREQLKSKLTRGRVYVTIIVESEKSGNRASINADVLGAYLTQLRDFAQAHKLRTEIEMNALVQLPDVVSGSDVEPGDDALWPLVEKSLSDALASCHEMRVDEGRALETDLTARMKAMDSIVAEIEKLAPDVSRKHAEAFHKRLDQLLGDVKIDEDRLAAEVAILADRLDFTEEITRLRSHEAQFNRALAEGGEVSKKLTYLLQEMHREASTIGAKASDSEVIQRVVALKEETEKIREQVQNIE